MNFFIPRSTHHATSLLIPHFSMFFFSHQEKQKRDCRLKLDMAVKQVQSISHENKLAQNRSKYQAEEIHSLREEIVHLQQTVLNLREISTRDDENIQILRHALALHNVPLPPMSGQIEAKEMSLTGRKEQSTPPPGAQL